MDRAKALDKIQKCLALSKSANEHEAARALAQAQKMMESFGVSEAELGAIGFCFETFKTTIQRGSGKIAPKTLTTITNLVQRAFGVEAVLSGSVRETDVNYEVKYFGPEHRVLMAMYAHEVIARTVERNWQQFLKENPHLKGRPGGRAGFYVGWCSAVSDTVMAFAVQPEERTGTSIAKHNYYGRELSTVAANKQKLFGSALDAGLQAGQGFRLHTPMNGTALARIGG